MLGANFAFAAGGDLAVTFDRRPATGVTATSAGSLTCISPPGASPGPVALTVSGTAGSASLANAFTYAADPTVALLPTIFGTTNYAASVLPILYQIQSALIALCEARTDAVAILNLPLHFEVQDCIGWLQGLRQSLGLPQAGMSYADARTIADLSYAAVYHPWLLVPDPWGQAGVRRPVPPDGAACGMSAGRELDRGVWVAPANDPLPGVLDLQPDFGNDDWATLFGAGFNLVRAEANDFRIMSAHTLSADQRMLQLSVRQLMIQLPQGRGRAGPGLCLRPQRRPAAAAVDGAVRDPARHDVQRRRLCRRDARRRLPYRDRRHRQHPCRFRAGPADRADPGRALAGRWNS